MRMFLAVFAGLLAIGTTAPWWGRSSTVAPGTPVIAVQPQRNLDPLLAASLDELRLLEALYEPLTRIAVPGLAVEPALATSWDVADDGLGWTFHLRTDARWSDGRPVTADQAVEGIERHRRQGSAVVSALSAVRAVRALDEHTLCIELSRPEPALAAMLALAPFAPAPPGLGDAPGAWADPTRFIGNGPFICAAHHPRHHLDLVPNPHYRGNHPAHSPIRLLIVPDATTAVRLYLDGAVDALLRLTPDTLADLRRVAQPGISQAPGWGIELYRLRALATDGRDAAILDGDLRRALARSVDRETLAREVLGGTVAPASTLVPPGPARALGYEPPIDELRYDLLRARQDLEAARRHLTAVPELELLLTAGSPERRRVAEHLADRWQRDLGVPVTVRTVPDTAFASRVQAVDYDLARGSILGDYLDPAYFLRCFRTGDGMNRTGFADAGFEQRLQAAESATTDRWQRLAEAERALLHQVPAIPLYQVNCTFLVRPGLGGIGANGLELVHLDEVHRMKHEDR